MYVNENVMMQLDPFSADPALPPTCLIVARVFCFPLMFEVGTQMRVHIEGYSPSCTSPYGSCSDVYWREDLKVILSIIDSRLSTPPCAHVSQVYI